MIDMSKQIILATARITLFSILEPDLFAKLAQEKGMAPDEFRAWAISVAIEQIKEEANIEK